MYHVLEREESCLQGFGVEIWRKKDRLGNLSVDRGMVLKLVFK